VSDCAATTLSGEIATSGNETWIPNHSSAVALRWAFPSGLLD